MKLRIVKYGKDNYGVERKGLFGWKCIHSTPGYVSSESAMEALARYLWPEVIYET